MEPVIEATEAHGENVFVERRNDSDIIIVLGENTLQGGWYTQLTRAEAFNIVDAIQEKLDEISDDLQGDLQG